MQIIAPVVNSKNLCGILEKDVFSFSDVIKLNNDLFKEAVVFDISKTLRYFNYDSDKKFYDIEILYKLKGYRFDSFLELASLVLGNQKVQKYKEFSEAINAFRKSFSLAKISVDKFFVEKLFPEKLLYNLYKERIFLLRELYEKIQKNQEIINFYNSIYDSIRILSKLEKVPLNFDEEFLKSNPTTKAESILQLIKNGTSKLKFNVVGAKTGRIGFKKNSINMYNMPKVLRKCLVVCEKKVLVEIDFKNFQPRIAIFLTKNDEFKKKFEKSEDIYAQFPGTRETNKIELISWMYSKGKNALFDKEAFPIKQLKDRIYEQSKIEGKVTNIFGRPLFFEDEEDHVVFQNFITSVEADIILNLINILDKEVFCESNSKILFPFYDSIIFEVDENEYELIEKSKKIMEKYVSDIMGGEFPVSVKVGKNFSEMK